MREPDSGRDELSILIGLETSDSDIDGAESLSELYRLARTAGFSVKGKFIQKRNRPHPRFYIGPGKIRELKGYIEENRVTLSIVDDELTPNQERNLEEELGCRVIDRTRLILDIFALHATTSAGKLQVELAQLEYYLPRLKTIWHEFSRLGGGMRTTRGPGEQRIEVDRRIISDRITAVRKNLEKLSRQRRDLSKQRKKSHLKTVSLTGYTNSGKSTLMNALTGADVQVVNKLFATLSPTTRRMECGKYELLLTDTVGFIRKLPHQVVEAFMATLEQVKEADILLHVIDYSAENYRHQIKAVEKVLGELKVLDRPVIRVYNKTDMLPESGNTPGKRSSDSVFISAKEGTGMEDLKAAIETHLDNLTVSLRLKIPQSRQEVINSIHRNCHVTGRNYSGNSVFIDCRMDSGLAGAYKEYIADETS